MDDPNPNIVISQLRDVIAELNRQKVSIEVRADKEIARLHTLLDAEVKYTRNLVGAISELKEGIGAGLATIRIAETLDLSGQLDAVIDQLSTCRDNADEYINPTAEEDNASS